MWYRKRDLKEKPTELLSSRYWIYISILSLREKSPKSRESIHFFNRLSYLYIEKPQRPFKDFPIKELIFSINFSLYPSRQYYMAIGIVLFFKRIIMNLGSEKVPIIINQDRP